MHFSLGEFDSASEAVRAGLRPPEREVAEDVMRSRIREALDDSRPSIPAAKVFVDLRLNTKSRAKALSVADKIVFRSAAAADLRQIYLNVSQYAGYGRAGDYLDRIEAACSRRRHFASGEGTRPPGAGAAYHQVRAERLDRVPRFRRHVEILACSGSDQDISTNCLVVMSASVG